MHTNMWCHHVTDSPTITKNKSTHACMQDFTGQPIQTYARKPIFTPMHAYARHHPTYPPSHIHKLHIIAHSSWHVRVQWLLLVLPAEETEPAGQSERTIKPQKATHTSINTCTHTRSQIQSSSACRVNAYYYTHMHAWPNSRSYILPHTLTTQHTHLAQTPIHGINPHTVSITGRFSHPTHTASSTRVHAAPVFACMHAKKCIYL